MSTKLKYTFEMMELDDRTVAVPVGQNSQEFRGVVKLNESAANIFDLLKHETSIEEIVAELKKQYGDESEIEDYVEEFVNYLSAEGVLE